MLFAAVVVQVVAAAGQPIERRLVIAGACLTAGVACLHVLINKSAASAPLHPRGVVEIAAGGVLELRKSDAGACIRVLPASPACAVALPKAAAEGTVFTIMNISLHPLDVKAAAFAVPPTGAACESVPAGDAVAFAVVAGKYTRIG